MIRKDIETITRGKPISGSTQAMPRTKAIFLSAILAMLTMGGRICAFGLPEPPPRLIVVGVVHSGSGGDAWVEEQLKSNGYRVIPVEAEPTDFQAFFAGYSGMDVLIVPFSDPGAKIAKARIYWRRSLSPISLQRTGEQALPELGDALVELLSSSRVLRGITEEEEAPPQDARPGLPAQGLRKLTFEAQRLIDAADYPAAIETLSRALEMESNDDQIHYNLAFCYKQTGDRERMLFHAKAGHRINPMNGAINVLLGNEYLSKGRRQLAIAAYKRALSFPPTRSVANWNLAVVYGKTGDVERVKRHLGAISTTAEQYENAQAWLETMNESERVSADRIRLFGIAAICFFAATTILLILTVVRQLKRAIARKAELRVEIATAIIGGLFTILTSLLTWIYGRW